MMSNRVWVLGFWACLSAIAHAQEGAPPSVTPEAVECFPACRAGYLCHQGQCISACNPVCEAGQVCTAEGQCAASAPATSAPVVVTPSPAAPSVVAPGTSDPVSSSTPWAPPPIGGGGAETKAGPESRLWFELVAFSNVIRDERTDEFGVETERDIATLSAVSLALRARVARGSLLVDADLPFAVGGLAFAEDLSTRFRSSTAAQLGNPNGSLSGIARFPNGNAWFSGGVGIALPVASFDETPSTDTETRDTLTSLMVLAAAAGMGGQWNVWRFAPHRLTLYVPLEIEGGSEQVRVGAELGIARMIYTGEIDETDVEIDDATVVQFGGRVEGKVSPQASLGLRLRGVYFSVVDDGTGLTADDKFQVSLEPFIDIQAGKHLFLGAGFVINLDDPNGLTSDDLFVYGLRFALGGTL